MNLKTNYDRKYKNKSLNLSPHFNNQFNYLLKLSKKKIKGTVLDLGCGTGEYSLRFQEMGYDVVGMDISKVAILKAKKAGVKKVKLGDFLNTNIKEKFDCIFVKGFSPLNTSDLSIFKKVVNKLDKMLSINGVIFYWGITNFKKSYSNSGWFNWDPKDLDSILRLHLLFIFRWQSYLPIKINNVISKILRYLKPSFRPCTMVGYRFKQK
ncbi:class I SAM-dependent methyltransferase [Candidatus Pelagibacter sp.]|nr:class I SAM-dependent methyltransferase [Candidatus Pelagibacter sp.]